jgi:hypothetical protein
MPGMSLLTFTQLPAPFRAWAVRGDATVWYAYICKQETTKGHPVDIDFSIGDVVRYEPFGGGERTVVVTHRAEHNGQDAFDADLIGTDEPRGVWGYADQITRNLGPARIAVVEGQADKVATIARYLPSNYSAKVDGEDVRIFGFDSAGWTLDDYVIPRLASGLWRAVEI